MKQTRPVLRYFGGKWLLAPWIISYFPPHRVYVEAFGGAGSVLMRKPRSYAEVYNDRWDQVVNVFRVLRDPDLALQLEKLIRLTPFSRTEFDQCSNEEMIALADPVEIARRTIFRSFAGYGSASVIDWYATGFRANSNRPGTIPAHDWSHYVNQIAIFTERLQGVVIENRPAADIIRQHDSLKTLHYLDPPYLHSTRNMRNRHASYAYEMNDDDHRALAMILRGLQGMVVISGYPSPLYDDELYPDWHRVTRRSHTDGARDREEVLWLSPNIRTGLL